MNSGSVISALDRKFLPLGQIFLFVRVIVSAQTSDNLYFGQRKMAVLHIIFLCPKLFFQQVRAEKRHVMRTFSLPLSTLFHLLGRYRKIPPAKMNLFIQLYNCNYLTVTVYVPAVSPVRSVSVARLTNSTLHFFVPVMVIVSSLPDFLTLIVVSAFAFMS